MQVPIFTKDLFHSAVLVSHFCKPLFGFRNSGVGIVKHLLTESKFFVYTIQLLAQFGHLGSQVSIINTVLPELSGYEIYLLLHLILTSMQVGNHGGDAFQFYLSPMYLLQ